MKLHGPWAMIGGLNDILIVKFPSIRLISLVVIYISELSGDLTWI